ncbi:hypothetical protein BDV96DRAFT_598329 [Lophiotrema nucula]|uniref:Uncharacterized protein n=1 Tax=Lophiotrema nucula TaxID=690887 RepID=A0A6A5ZG90_9PLEO|nr:hypothetical protein BDV96DRAFT_598329 [Lophiotrema nucula]
MAPKISRKTSVGQLNSYGEKGETSKNWLARHLRLPLPRQAKGPDNGCETHRPRTAPSIGTARKPFAISTAVEPPLVRPLNKPPPRPPRPDSGVIRDVNAWLDASMIKPAAPLMGGIPYWREGEEPGAAPCPDVRYAIPIVKEPETERPTTSHSQQIASFCRRAKKIQVRMPTLLRTKSHRVAVQQKQANRRSTSMPLLSKPLPPLPPLPPLLTIGNGGVSTPHLLRRSRSLAQITSRSQVTSVSSGGWLGGQRHYVAVGGRLGTPLDRDSAILQSVRGPLEHPPIRRSPAGLGIPREDSMGNLSDAPTYSTGPPPPSYRSHAASILSTSSFGCVDGMDAEHRQISQQRAAQRSRGIKCRFKRMAQRAHLAK